MTAAAAVQLSTRDAVTATAEAVTVTSVFASLRARGVCDRKPKTHDMHIGALTYLACVLQPLKQTCRIDCIFHRCERFLQPCDGHLLEARREGNRVQALGEVGDIDDSR